MSKKCLFENCSKLVEFTCECTPKAYLCSKHLQPHIEQNDMLHGIISNFIEIAKDKMPEILSKLNKKIQQITSAKVQIKKICSDIIDFVNKECIKVTTKLQENKNYFMKIKKVLELKGKVEREVFEKFTYAYNIKLRSNINYSTVELEINRLFDEHSSLNDQFDDDEYIFFIHGTEFVKIDLETLKQSKSTFHKSLSYNQGCKE